MNSSVKEHGTYPWHSAKIAGSKASSTGTTAQVRIVPAVVNFMTLCMLQNLVMPFHKGNAMLIGEPSFQGEAVT